MTARHGVTLLELSITMTLLAIIASVTVLAIRRFEAPRPDDPRQILADSARNVLATGRAAHVRIVVNGALATAIVRPDGSIIADSALAVERLTGLPVHAR